MIRRICFIFIFFHLVDMHLPIFKSRPITRYVQWVSWALILKRTLSNVIEVSCPNHTSHTPYLTQKHTHHNEKPSLLLMNSTINFVWAKQSNYLSQARKQPSLHWFFNQNDNKGKFSSKSTSWNKKKTRTWTQHVQNNNPIRFFYKEE